MASLILITLLVAAVARSRMGTLMDLRRSHPREYWNVVMPLVIVSVEMMDLEAKTSMTVQKLLSVNLGKFEENMIKSVNRDGFWSVENVRERFGRGEIPEVSGVHYTVGRVLAMITTNVGRPSLDQWHLQPDQKLLVLNRIPFDHLAIYRAFPSFTGDP
jgi:hypothetical protein